MKAQRILVAATLGIGVAGFGLNGMAQNQGQGVGERTGQALDRAAQQTGDAVRRGVDRLDTSTTQPSAEAPNAEAIRDTLAEVTEAALTRGGFDDLIERLVDADRNRLGRDSFVEQDHATLDGRIAQLQKDWQAKYGQEFDIDDENAVYTSSFATIIQSEIPDSTRLASERRPAGDATAPDAPRATNDVPRPGNTDANRPAGADRDRNDITGGDANREPGRDVATVSIMQSHGLPALQVPMTREMINAWKINIPDDYTAQKLHDNLLTQLTHINNQKDQWPADVNEAYRMVTHRVLLAVMNADEQALGAGGATDLNRQQGNRPGMGGGNMGGNNGGNMGGNTGGTNTR